MIAATGLLVFPLIEGRDLGWPIWAYAMIGTSALLFGVFAWWQRRAERAGGSPLVVPALFRRRSFSLGLVVSLLLFAAVACFALTFTLLLQLGYRFSAIHTVLTGLFITVGIVVSAGAMSKKIIPALGRWSLTIGILIMAASSAAQHRSGRDILPASSNRRRRLRDPSITTRWPTRAISAIPVCDGGVMTSTGATSTRVRGSDPAVAMPFAVDLHGVHKSFGAVKAVRGIDLVVRPGEVMAFLGPNGAGKTSTIDIILGLSRPSTGEVEVFGMVPREAISRGLVSAVMQTGGLLKDLTVAETARYTAKLFAASRPVDEVLARAGIADIADRLVGKCSGGEQQRLRFAMALLPDPELLILDEPTQGMDVEGRREFWKAIREDAAKGRTILFATHYLEEADAYADRIVLIRKGEIVADGTAAEVKSLAAGRTVRATLPAADESRLRGIPGADSVEVRGDTVLIHSGDSDTVARHLLNETSARDLEINARGLEEAFIALTGAGDEDTDDSPTGRER